MKRTPAPNRIDCVPGHNAGERFSGLMNHNPVAANTTRIASLMATMIVSPRPMILAPNAFTTVTKRTEPIANDLSSNADGVSVMKVAA
jgi:hypothetical protein